MTAESELDARVRAAVGDRVPGVVVVVVGAEGVRACASVGVADLVMRDRITTEMAVPWFSMTKIVTATTAIRLVEQGILELDRPVLPLVPALEELRPLTSVAQITLRHLLQHTAGLVNPLPVRWIHAAETPAPEPDAFLRRLLRGHDKLAFEPGERSSYSNLGSLVVGAAVAHATGTPFTENVRTYVLDPVAMPSTGFSLPANVPTVTGYHPRRDPLRLLLPRWVESETSGRWVGFRPFLPDGAAYGGLVGTAADAARFLRMHLAGGTIDGTRVLTADATATMQQIDAEGRRFDLGLGWFRPVADREADPAFIEHLGGGAGFFNVMRMYPTEGVGAVVMGNATKYDVDAVARLALDYRD